MGVGARPGFITILGAGSGTPLVGQLAAILIVLFCFHAQQKGAEQLGFAIEFPVQVIDGWDVVGDQIRKALPPLLTL
jgi:hypothetical protein